MVRKRRKRLAVEALESRVLLSITSLDVQQIWSHSDRSSKLAVHWTDSELTSEQSYEVWIDQELPGDRRLSKIYHQSGIAAGPDLQIDQFFLPGNYNVYIRRDTVNHVSAWVGQSVTVSDAANDQLNSEIESPDRAQINVFRQGQAANGQVVSEGAISWTGNAAIYDVWLEHSSADAGRSPVAVVRNVNRNSISLRELAKASEKGKPILYADLEAKPSQLPSGQYRVYVRGLNGAVDENGHWIGQGEWSEPYEFEFHSVEGSDAIPKNLRASNEIRPLIAWDSVPNAEAYLLSLWKGPDYENHRAVNLRVYGTRFRPSQSMVTGQNGRLQISPGDEIYVRVRGIGSEGMLEGMRPGNFASTVLSVPAQLTPDELPAPDIVGPAATIPDRMPVLRWNDSPNAGSYEIWFTSLRTRQQVFHAKGIEANYLHLSPDVLQASSNISDSNSEYDLMSGLADGRYRFWVRSVNPAASALGSWSRSHEFTVDSDLVDELSPPPADGAASASLVAPNLVTTHTENGIDYVLVTNGLGESFGASVLARYVLSDDGQLIRPTTIDPLSGQSIQFFPDLPMGRNVSDIEFLGESQLVVLSRGSNEVRLVNLSDWSVESSYALSPGAGGESPDAMKLEVLSNGQILVVFNRSDRLRVLAVKPDGTLTEVLVPNATPSNQGFVLPQGRAMNVTAVDNDDGSYLIFLATPALNGTVVLRYDPETVQFETVAAPLARRTGSSQFISSSIVTLPDGDKTSTYYLSADRNGFLTWINTDSLAYDFFDLVPLIPCSSRDQNAVHYASADDNSVDPTRMVRTSADSLAIFNNRQFSVEVSLSSDRGSLGVEFLQAMPAAYSGAVVETANGRRTIIASPVKSALYSVPDSSEPPHEPQIRRTVSTFLDAIGLADKVLSLSSDDTVRLLDAEADIGVGSADDPLREIIDQAGRVYRVTDGPIATFHDRNNGRLFAAVTVADGAFSSDPSSCELPERFVAFLDLSDWNSLVVLNVVSLSQVHKPYRFELTEHSLRVVDRLGSVMATFHDWQGDSPRFERRNFGEMHQPGFGQTRPARSLTMGDGTVVVLHDTTPDKVFSVLTSDSETATVHAHNVGEWFYDMAKFDDDRIVAVTWDAVAVILNIRTGVFEFVQKLDQFPDMNLSLYGIRGISFYENTLSVSSPAAGLVAEFEFEPARSGSGHSARLVRLFRSTDVVTTLLTEESNWIIENQRVIRLSR